MKMPVFLNLNLLLLLVSGSTASVMLLKPLPCPGLLTAAGKHFSAAFFCRAEGLEVASNGDDDNDDDQEDQVLGRTTLCDLLPLPLFERKSGSGAVNTIFANSLTNRDGGIYDTIPYSSWFPTEKLKKKSFHDAVMQLQLSQSVNTAPEATFLQALQETLGLRITGLLIEVADEHSNGAVTLAAAALLARCDATAPAGSWDLASGGAELLNCLRQPQARDQASLVPIHKDELVSLALSTGMPVCVDRALFLSLSVDADLVRAPGVAEGEGKRTASSSLIKATYSCRAADRGASSSSTAGGAVPAAWDIFSPDAFLRMTSLQKRAVLRASGVTDLPRPRQGRAALDRALLAVMDDAVRSEVTRLSGGLRTVGRRDANGTNSCSSISGSGSSFQSSSSSGSRAALLEAMGAALERGDTDEAERLREEFALKTRLRADPTQAQGAYDRYLDQDDWYMRERQRAMAPRKPGAPGST